MSKVVPGVGFYQPTTGGPSTPIDIILGDLIPPPDAILDAPTVTSLTGPSLLDVAAAEILMDSPQAFFFSGIDSSSDDRRMVFEGCTRRVTFEVAATRRVAFDE